VISPSIRPSVGSIVSLAVIVSSANVKISSAGFYIHYNSAVVKPISIRDGGLFNGPFDQRDDGSSLYAKTSLSPNLGSIPAAGQLIVVDFQVIGTGPADIGFDMIEIFGADQQQVPVINSPIPTITAIGPRQGGQQ
ncbi:MAG TPA: cohesin domain-containing protein, partial [Acidobacteriota bacterium]|nr:cohesin domain-containing protein [Acidobacteriota bacterium]